MDDITASAVDELDFETARGCWAYRSASATVYWLDLTQGGCFASPAKDPPPAHTTTSGCRSSPRGTTGVKRGSPSAAVTAS